MKIYIIYLAAILFVFTSCEKESLEPELFEADLKVKVLDAHAHAKNVQTFRAHLTGDEEVSPVSTNATGQTIFKLSKDGTELSYKLIVANIEDVLAAHIHIGDPGINGGVAVGLYTGGLIEGRFSGILAQGTITSANISPNINLTWDQLIEIMLDGGAYVNVHTSENPGGEIRGQIYANN